MKTIACHGKRPYAFYFFAAYAVPVAVVSWFLPPSASASALSRRYAVYPEKLGSAVVFHILQGPSVLSSSSSWMLPSYSNRPSSQNPYSVCTIYCTWWLSHGMQHTHLCLLFSALLSSLLLLLRQISFSFWVVEILTVDYLHYQFTSNSAALSSCHIYN